VKLYTETMLAKTQGLATFSRMQQWRQVEVIYFLTPYGRYGIATALLAHLISLTILSKISFDDR
jgi:hypothetical protein